MSSAVRNNVADGLSGNISDQAFSLEQLNDQIDLARADFAHKYAATTKLDPTYMVQSPRELFKITCKNMSPDCGIEGWGENIASITVPKIMPLFEDQAIQYLGLNNMQEAFRVYMHPEDIRNHKLKMRTRNLPYAWLDTAANTEDKHTIWFFNMGSYNSLQFLKLRAVFEQPSKINANMPNYLDMEYPAPLHMQNAIVDALTEKYIRYYRQLNVPIQSTTNTQTDNIT
jgi:hypothetical protein